MEILDDGFNGIQVNWYNYGFKCLDPTLGMWHAPDSLSESYYSTSHYAFAGNNPISNKEILGLDWYATSDVYAKDYEGTIKYGSNTFYSTKTGEGYFTEENGYRTYFTRIGAGKVFGNQIDWGGGSNDILLFGMTADFDYCGTYYIDQDSYDRQLGQLNSAIDNLMTSIDLDLCNEDANSGGGEISYLGGIGIGTAGSGLSFEFALPKVFTNNLSSYTGVGVDVSILKDKNGLGFYLTTKTTKETGIAFSAQIETFRAFNRFSNPNTNIDRTYLEELGHEFALGIGPVGGSYSTSNASDYNAISPYQVVTISYGVGFDIGFVDWDTNTSVTGGN